MVFVFIFTTNTWQRVLSHNNGFLIVWGFFSIITGGWDIGKLDLENGSSFEVSAQADECDHCRLAHPGSPALSHSRAEHAHHRTGDSAAPGVAGGESSQTNTCFSGKDIFTCFYTSTTFLKYTMIANAFISVTHISLMKCTSFFHKLSYDFIKLSSCKRKKQVVLFMKTFLCIFRGDTFLLL